jgi:hypothetical protein
MSERFKQFQAVFPEEACLAALMRARHGGAGVTCAACGRTSLFEQRPKLRAYCCGHCHYMVYPAAGTPLENRRTALQSWFFAIKVMAETGGKGAAGVIEREAKVPSLTARRLADELAALAAPSAGREPAWFETLRRSVTGETASAPEPRASKAAVAPAGAAVPREASERSRPSAPPTDRAAVQAAPGARHQTAPAVAPGLSGRMMLIGLAGGVACIAIAVLGIAMAKLRQEEPAPDPEMVAIIEAPSLQAAARPSLILSSVESDLEAARQATQFALNNDPSLAAIKSQANDPDDTPDMSQVQPPPNILLVPPRLPPALAPRKSEIPRAPIASGDPEQLLTFGPIRIRRHLVDTIVRAGRVVGADPTLLMAVADKESSFSTAVQAKTSSATGLYQFIEQTWLGVISEFGSRHGLVAEARLIGRSGRQFTVPDPAERQRILDLRREPYISALLAAEMLKRDTLRLEKALGRHLTGGEIYLIHFLGPDAAQTFIETMEETPGTKAAELLPRPAQANRPIFYAEAGGETKTLSVSEVHKKFNDMIKIRLDRYSAVRPGASQGANRQPAGR